MLNVESLGRISEAIPSAILDIRYATANNITGSALYTQPADYLRHEPLEALRNTAKKLQELGGLRIVIFDVLRPQFAQDKLIEVCDNSDYVALISNHRRGISVDATVATDAGKLLDMGTDYDEFSELVHSDAVGLSDLQIHNRQILKGSMESESFLQYPWEWYHFDFKPEQEWELFEDESIKSLF